MSTTTRAAVAALALTFLGAACATEADGDRAIPDPVEPAGAGPETNSGNEDNPPPADLNGDLACTVDPVTDWVGASGTVTNRSSGTSTYSIAVNFTDAAGVVYASGTAFLTNIAAGQTGSFDIQSFARAAEGGSCAVVEIDRFAS